MNFEQQTMFDQSMYGLCLNNGGYEDIPDFNEWGDWTCETATLKVTKKNNLHTYCNSEYTMKVNETNGLYIRNFSVKSEKDKIDQETKHINDKREYVKRYGITKVKT